MTADDYRQMPETGPRYQLVEGRFHMSPAPNRYHQQIVGTIYHLMRRFLEDHPIGEVYVSPFDVYLTENDVYQPDVIFVSRSNSAILTAAGAEGPPDLAVEVLSKGTAFLDVGTKRSVYAQTGVKELWIVDPEAMNVQVYRLAVDANAPEATYDSQAQFSSHLLPGLVLRVAEIFKR